MLLTDAEQRELLDTTRQRAQVAMLQYASVLTQQRIATTTATGGASTYIVGSAPLDSSMIGDFGRDFGAAVQLHSIVSEELSTLYARSRSAATPSGAKGSTTAERTWGPASWQQRLLAAMYGGDALAADAATPWPATHASPGYATWLPQDWPSAAQLPYVSEYVTEPQVQRFIALLRQHGMLDFATTWQSGADYCLRIDAAGEARNVFDKLQQRLACDAFGCAGGKADFTDLCPASATAGSAPTCRQLYAVNAKEDRLLRDYAITPEHAAKALRVLDQMVGPLQKLGASTGWQLQTSGWSSCNGQRGAMDVVGDVKLDGSGGGRVSFSADVRFVGRDIQQLAGSLHALEPFGYAVTGYSSAVDTAVSVTAPKMPGASDPTYSYSVPIDPTECNASRDRDRLMGSLQAMSATAMLMTTDLAPSDGSWAHVAQALSLLRTETGTSVAVSAVSAPTNRTQLTADLPSTHAFRPDRCVETYRYAMSAAGLSTWDVRVLPQQADPFWANADSIDLLAVKPDRWLASRLLSPGSDVLGGAVPSDVSRVAVMNKVGTGANARFETRFDVMVGDDVTLVARKGSPGGYSYRILGDMLLMTGQHPGETYYFTDRGGKLSGFVADQMLPDPLNPAEPAFDAFGYPRKWTPPLNAALFGEHSEVPAFQHYLAQAQSTSDAATAAVQTAIQGVVTEQQNDVSAQLQTAKSQQTLKEDVQKLCGAEAASCTPEIVDLTPDAKLWPHLVDLQGLAKSAGTDKVCDGTDDPLNDDQLPGCIAKLVSDALTKMTIRVAKPVKDAIDAGGDEVPTFSQFAGGELQNVLIEQWRAVKQQPNQELQVLAQELAAFRLQMAAAVSSLEPARVSMDDKCGGAPSIDEVRAGVRAAAKVTLGRIATLAFRQFTRSLGDMAVNAGVAAAGGAAVGSVVPGVGTVAGAAVAAIGSALMSYLNRADCELASAQFNAGIDSAAASLAGSAVRLTERSNALQTAMVQIAQTSAAVDRVRLQAQVAQQRADFETDLAKQGNPSSFGLARRYRTYDMWRARALLDNARRYGLAARRAVEAQYVVDLSRLTANEPFVASPRSWADGIYEYDLSVPHSVGLTGSLGESKSGIYSNKLSDYVRNLQGFVNGYAVARPTAIASSDSHLVTVGGLGDAANQADWQLLCPDGKWVSGFSAAGPDGACFVSSPAVTSCRARLDSVYRWPDAARMASISKALASGAIRPVGNFDTRWLASLAGLANDLHPACSIELFVEEDCRRLLEAWHGEITMDVTAVSKLTDAGVFRVAQQVSPALAECPAMRPLKARRTFLFDAWGEVVGSVAAASNAGLPPRRYNARWTQLAVNLVGTGVIDCAGSPDPLACYGRGWTGYDLEQRSTPVTTDYQGQLQWLRLPGANIESAKAIAAERFLDSMRDGFSSPFVAPVARGELYWRPLGGEYVLTINAGNEVRLERLERVQVVVGSTYWVRQN